MARKTRAIFTEFPGFECKAVTSREQPFLLRPGRTRSLETLVDEPANEFRDGHTLRLRLRVKSGLASVAYVPDVQRNHE